MEACGKVTMDVGSVRGEVGVGRVSVSVACVCVRVSVVRGDEGIGDEGAKGRFESPPPRRRRRTGVIPAAPNKKEEKKFAAVHGVKKGGTGVGEGGAGEQDRCMRGPYSPWGRGCVWHVLHYC